jgi:ATP-dependent Clp protease ATP-binding subunit ClpB
MGRVLRPTTFGCHDASNQVLTGAEREAERLKDESVSVEHVLLALLATGPGSAAGRMLHDHGVTRERLQKALRQMRGTSGA